MTENKNGWGGICRKCFHHVKYWHHHLCLREALATVNAWHLKISTISSSESSATTKSLNLNLFISEKKKKQKEEKNLYVHTEKVDGYDKKCTHAYKGDGLVKKWWCWGCALFEWSQETTDTRDTRDVWATRVQHESNTNDKNVTQVKNFNFKNSAY